MTSIGLDLLRAHPLTAASVVQGCGEHLWSALTPTICDALRRFVNFSCAHALTREIQYESALNYYYTFVNSINARPIYKHHTLEIETLSVGVCELW